MQTISELAIWYLKVGGVLGFTFGALSWGLPRAVGWPLHHVLITVPFWPYMVYRTFRPRRDT